MAEPVEQLWLPDPEAEEQSDADNALDALGITDASLLESALQEISHRVFVPHDGGQLDVMQDERRFRVLAAGRRWGKTKLAAHEVIEAALSRPNSVVWWVANTYRNVARGYKEVVRQLPPSLLKKAAPSYTSNTLYLQFANGSVIEFYSGGSPDALAGEGVHFMVVDEGALIPDNVWNQMLRPTLMDTGGRALVISTPRGHNWFWKLHQLGLKGQTGYGAYHFPQTSNPYVPLEETEAVKKELPDMIFRQEIMAEFVAAGASIFGTGLEHRGAIVPDVALAEGHIVMGIDLAKHNDFTVLSASRGRDRMPVHRERFNDISWPAQRRRIRAATELLRNEPLVKSLTVLMDTTGVGDVVFDDLIEEDLDVIPRQFTNQWKDAAVRLLAADMEQGDAHILQEQLPEFSSYAMEMTPAGRYKYEAATGHDDEVSAKLLEHWGIVHETAMEIQSISVHPNDVPAPEDTEPQPEKELVRDDPLAIMNRPGAWG